MGRRIAEDVDEGERGEREPLQGAGERETATSGDEVDKRGSGRKEGSCGT